jgi:hypothetical protein
VALVGLVELVLHHHSKDWVAVAVQVVGLLFKFIQQPLCPVRNHIQLVALVRHHHLALHL